MARVILGLGSNLKNRQKMLFKAMELIKNRVGSLLDHSSIYETEPLYYKEQPDFLNMVIEIDTSLAPESLLSSLQEIEKELGRIKKAQANRSRKIDIDILYYDNRIINKDNLQIPHPRIKERKFVLIPLEEIASSFKDPVSGQSIVRLNKNCS